jgi:DNA polymerase Pol2
MERREKKARLDSLAELRRIRIEGGSRIEALKREDDEAVDSAEYYDEEDDDEFIEHDPVERKRPTFSAFKSRGERVEPAAGDDYFNSLLSKMDAEVSSSESESEIKVEVDECNDDLLKKPSMEIGTITSAAEPLSSEFAPKEGAFEMDDKMLTEQLAKVHWSDLDEDAGGIEDFLKENHVDLEKENVNFIPMKVDENVDTLDTGAIEIDPTPSSMTTTLPVTIVGEAVDFYWIDAYEKPNGTIFLFGKVSNGGGSFVSCCLTVNGMKRNLFFLPRETLVDTGEEVTLRDVHDEIATLAASHRITKFGCKKVLRKYAFEIADIPVEADYVKMIYPFGEAQLPKDLTGKSFCHVFGVGTSALELFLLKRRIMGPCWLRFTPTSTVKRNVSWCRLEMEVNDPKSISILQNGPEPPTLTVLSLSIRTIVHEPSKTHEVVSASGLIYNNVQVEGTTTSDRPKCNAVFSIAREAENLGFTNKFMDSVLKGYGGKVELAKSERALLGYLIAMIYRSDPDVIVGHNFLGFDLGVLLHRMRACKVDFWSRIGRLNWSQ